MFRNKSKSDNSSSEQNNIFCRYEVCIKKKIEDKDEQSWMMLNKVIPTNVDGIFKNFWGKPEESSDDLVKSNVEKWHTEYLNLLSKQKTIDEAWSKYLLKFKKMNKKQQACEVKYFEENLVMRFSNDKNKQRELIHELEIISLSDE